MSYTTEQQEGFANDGIAKTIKLFDRVERIALKLEPERTEVEGNPLACGIGSVGGLHEEVTGEEPKTAPSGIRTLPVLRIGTVTFSKPSVCQTLSPSPSNWVVEVDVQTCDAGTTKLWAPLGGSNTDDKWYTGNQIFDPNHSSDRSEITDHWIAELFRLPEPGRSTR